MTPRVQNPVEQVLAKIRGKARSEILLLNIRDFENLLAALPAGSTFGPVMIQYDRGCLTIKRVRA